MKNTVKMYIEKKNAEGGINGHKLEWYVYDAASEVTKGVNAAKRLIEQDQVAIVVGDGNSSAVAISLAPIFEKAKVPFISLSGSKKIASPIEEKRWVFKAVQEDTDGVIKTIEFWKHKGYEKVAFLTDTSGWGKSAKEEFEIYLKDSGIKGVAWEEFDPSATDLTPQLVRIKKEDPDVIICWTVTPAGVVFLKNVQQLGLNDKVIMHGQGFVSERYMKLAGNAAQGLFLAGFRFSVRDQLPKDDPLRKTIFKYMKEYKDYYGEDPNFYGTNGYEGIHLAFKALEAAGDDKEKLRTALENIKGFVGTQRIHNFSSENHRGSSPETMTIIKWENEKWKMVYY
jgi:branched-chain amino acid transport system substrate-binding protein